jgi:hypothetical protein
MARTFPRVEISIVSLEYACLSEDQLTSFLNLMLPALTKKHSHTLELVLPMSE